MKYILTTLILVLALSLGHAQSLLDYVSSNESLSTFYALVRQAGLTETLSQENLTLFVPSNNAFDTVSAEQLAQLKANSTRLEQVLKYHMVLGLLDSANVPNYPAVLTLEGRYLTTMLTNSGFQAAEANVQQADLRLSNGIIHVIDSVILPPQNLMQSIRYPLTERNNTNVFGTVVLKGNATQTTISVLLSGTVIGEHHPVKIHAGNCSSGGQILVDLYDVVGTNGISRSTVNIPFESLVTTDAYINVQISADKPNFDIACGELGLNAKN